MILTGFKTTESEYEGKTYSKVTLYFTGTEFESESADVIGQSTALYTIKNDNETFDM